MLSDALSYMNTTFTLFFTIECVLKLITFGRVNYIFVVLVQLHAWTCLVLKKKWWYRPLVWVRSSVRTSCVCSSVKTKQLHNNFLLQELFQRTLEHLWPHHCAGQHCRCLDGGIRGESELLPHCCFHEFFWLIFFKIWENSSILIITEWWLRNFWGVWKK